MTKAKYYINVLSPSELNNKQKMNLLEEIRTAIRSVEKNNPDKKFVIGKEFTTEELLESLRETPEDPDVDDCKHYDEAQGRHKCIHPLVIGHRCNGLCNYYEEIE